MAWPEELLTNSPTVIRKAKCRRVVALLAINRREVIENCGKRVAVRAQSLFDDYTTAFERRQSFSAFILVCVDATQHVQTNPHSDVFLAVGFLEDCQRSEE